MQQRSLEKAAKPKKHNKPKPVVVEEEDIMDELPTGTIAVTVPITVAGLCEQAGISTSQVIMALMKMGIMANINQNLDEDTVMILAENCLKEISHIANLNPQTINTSKIINSIQNIPNNHSIIPLYGSKPYNTYAERLFNIIFQEVSLDKKRFPTLKTIFNNT